MIETPRLLIQEFTPSDFADFFALMKDPEVMYFSIGGPLEEAEAKERFENRILNHYKEHGIGLWALVLKETGKIIGLAGLITQKIDDIEMIELGYRLFPAFWRKGLASEACFAISEYAFHQLGLKTIVSIIDPKNIASIKVAKKIGMAFLKKGVFHGHLIDIYAKEIYGNH